MQSGPGIENNPILALLGDSTDGPDDPVEQTHSIFWRVHDPIERCSQIRSTAPPPVDLPNSDLFWATIDVNNTADNEELYQFLSKNYGADNVQYRLCYTRDHLAWILQPPGYLPALHLALRQKISGSSDQASQLVGFVAGIPCTISLREAPNSNEPELVPSMEVNLLCLTPALRGLGLGPLLIREITRRILTLCPRTQMAVYTTSVPLPGEVARSRYYYQPLNIPRLVECGWMPTPDAAEADYYRLPRSSLRPTVRRLSVADISEARSLLNRQQAQFCMGRHWDSDIEFQHCFLPRPDGTVETWIIESPPEDGTHHLAGLISFSVIPFVPQTLGREAPSTGGPIRAAFANYAVVDCPRPAETPGEGHIHPCPQRLVEIYTDALIVARDLCNAHLFNILDTQHCIELVEPLHFNPVMAATMHVYIYNRKVRNLTAPEIGIVLS
ncbi:putative Glycylpeptide N-tetradecanoyltransferase 1 [Paratrimastix pyriformis]|uniref:Glycylpeptide N-tetradecanoyltransferase n=1 Tax=Paratrimastix pyriformis TaxID=342808 RepID=A0ABQ8UZ73_9EUKA|nr:putative Glycylpeptide N-tetradecanoyltransferase 1 [Paratrimastix pyriformis]